MGRGGVMWGIITKIKRLASAVVGALAAAVIVVAGVVVNVNLAVAQ